MTFKEIVDLTKNRIDEVDEDEQIDIIVKNAINFAYSLLFVKVDNDIKTSSLTYSDVIKLPSDLYSIIRLASGTTELNEFDYDLKGNFIIIRNSSLKSNLSISYSYYPAKLTADTDVINLKDIFCIALSIYASYVYYIYRKKTDVAAMLLNEWNGIVNNINKVGDK